MLDRRQSVREKVLYGGVADIAGRGVTTNCVVRNISEQGACVEIDPTARLPEQWNLTIAHKGRSYLARLIWRQANKVGLAFRIMTLMPPSAISTNGCAGAKSRSASFSAASTNCSDKANIQPAKRQMNRHL